MSDPAATHRDLLALCCLTDGDDRCDWGVIACQAHRERTLDALKDGTVVESNARAHRTWWLISTATPAPWTFPKRNEVTSGISQGTVVIEASQKSGARMQARLAYEHGKHVFLVESLTTAQEWARKMLDAGRAIPVRDFDDLARELVTADRLLAASKELHLEPFAL